MEEQQIPLFEGVSQYAIDSLMNDPRNAGRTYREGDYVVRQGTLCRSLYILTKGTLHATMTNEEAKEVTIERLEAPEVLAPAFIYGDENRFPVNLTAQTDCKVCIINKDSFLRFMHENPTVMQKFIIQISNRCVFLSRKLNEFALQNLRNRVVNYLNRHGSITNQQKVASVLGVARPSLARMLAEMIKDGTVEKDGNVVRLVK